MRSPCVGDEGGGCAGPQVASFTTSSWMTSCSVGDARGEGGEKSSSRWPLCWRIKAIIHWRGCRRSDWSDAHAVEVGGWGREGWERLLGKDG